MVDEDAVIPFTRWRDDLDTWVIPSVTYQWKQKQLDDGSWDVIVDHNETNGGENPLGISAQAAAPTLPLALSIASLLLKRDVYVHQLAGLASQPITAEALS